LGHLSWTFGGGLEDGSTTQERPRVARCGGHWYRTWSVVVGAPGETARSRIGVGRPREADRFTGQTDGPRDCVHNHRRGAGSIVGDGSPEVTALPVLHGPGDRPADRARRRQEAPAFKFGFRGPVGRTDRTPGKELRWVRSIPERILCPRGLGAASRPDDIGSEAGVVADGRRRLERRVRPAHLFCAEIFAGTPRRRGATPEKKKGL